ncbi:Alpha/beta fold hydrolase OS=Streptomyces tendae OX=1932 GN=GUR47_11855 PE=4 SV=1 [Streptomyces tendae]
MAMEATRPATIASDIAKPLSTELGYDRVPLHAAHSLRAFFRLADGDLPQVTQPLLLLRSPQDHVVPPADSARILGRVSSTDVTEILLEQKGLTVATLDRDADRIFAESVAFIGRLAPGSVGEPESGLGKEGTTAGG